MISTSRKLALTLVGLLVIWGVGVALAQASDDTWITTKIRIATAGPNAVYGLEPGGMLHAFLASPEESSKEPIRAARYQVVLPDRRITITPGQQETLEELRREYPREIDRIAALYRDAGKLAQKAASSRISAYLNTRRSAGKFLGRYRFSQELLAYLSVQSRYFFGQGLGNASAQLSGASVIHSTCRVPGRIRTSSCPYRIAH